MLSVLLFGAPLIALDERVADVRRRKSRALLYYLAAQGAPVARERLLAVFWPDYDRASAQHMLRTNLYDLRKALGDALVADDTLLALVSGAKVDTRTLEATVTSSSADAEQLAAALELYRGPFLADFALPDTPAFDDWAAAARERYHQLAVRGWGALSRLREAQGDLGAALAALDRALALEPLQESLQRAALRVSYLAGDRANAIRRYERLARLLDDELGVPPMAETQAVYDAIIKDEGGRRKDEAPARAQRSLRRLHPASCIPHPSALPFTGRDTELDILRELAQSHALALIEGEPGIGKTRLAEEFMRAEREQGALALFGAARELEQALPYQPIIAALRSLLALPAWPALLARLALPAVWLAEAARLLPELASDASALPTPAPPADESRLWEGVHQFLCALARQRRMVLCLDDIHWADGSTLALLGYLTRQAATAAAPIVFIATTRPAAPGAPVGRLAQALIREGRLRRMPLDRLSADDIAALAGYISPVDAGALATWLIQVSEGNPYVLAELVRDARARGLLRADGTIDARALLTGRAVPPSVYMLMQSRLARLSATARRVLDVAVTVGRDFPFDVVARTVALAEDVALDALDELRAAGLVAPRDGLRYSFDHSLTVEVARREIGEPRRRALHRRVAEALEAIHHQRPGATVELIATHFAQGGDVERAAPYAFQSGKRAAALAAWSEAIGFFELALEGTPAPRRYPIAMEMGGALLQSGDLARSAELLRQALTEAQAQGDGAGADAARFALVGALLPQARYAEVIALVQETNLPAGPANAARAAFLWGTALSLEGADLESAAAHLRRAVALLAEQGAPDAVLLIRARHELGIVLAEQGALAAAVACWRAALAAATLAGPAASAALYWHAIAYNNLAYHLHLLGDPTARGYAEAGLALAREKGALAPMPFLLSTLGEIALAAGDLASAERHFAEGLDLARRLGAAERIAGLTANLGRVAARRQEATRASELLSTALAQADALGLRHLSAEIRIWLAPLLPSSAARARLGEARAIAATSGRQLLLEQIAHLEAQL